MGERETERETETEREPSRPGLLRTPGLVST